MPKAPASVKREAARVGGASLEPCGSREAEDSGYSSRHEIVTNRPPARVSASWMAPEL